MPPGIQADPSTPNNSCPASLPTLWTHGSGHTGRPQLPRTSGPGSQGGSASTICGWDPLLFRTAPQHRTRVTFLPQDTQRATCCGHVLDRFCGHAAGCTCAGYRNRRHNLFHEAAQEAHPHGEKSGLHQRRPGTDGLPQRTSLDRPTDVRIPTGKTQLQKLGTVSPFL